MVKHPECVKHIHKVGQSHAYIRCIYGIWGREITKYTVIHNVHIRFRPALHIPIQHQISVTSATFNINGIAGSGVSGLYLRKENVLSVQGKCVKWSFFIQGFCFICTRRMFSVVFIYTRQMFPLVFTRQMCYLYKAHVLSVQGKCFQWSLSV
jgi:hypothetical protein